MNTDLFFTVTSPAQFIVLLPIGFLFGWADFAGPQPGRRALGMLEVLGIFWAFTLTVRWHTGIQAWERSVGTVLLSFLFVLAIYAGHKIRLRVSGWYGRDR